MDFLLHINYKNRSWIQLVLIGIGLFLLIPESSGQHGGGVKPDPAKRKEWMLETKARMLKFSPRKKVVRLSPQLEHYDTYTRISFQAGKEGVIYFGKKDWIYLVSSNSHDQPEVGDLTLGMDQAQNFYVHTGHVCGGIVRYICDELEEISTSAMFFTYFKDDTDKLPWKHLNN